MFDIKYLRNLLKPMNFKITGDLLPKICEIWPDPETGNKGIEQKHLVKYTPLTSGAVSNYFNGRIPSDEARDHLSNFFGIIYFSNNPEINNEQQLKRLENFFDSFVYNKKNSRS